MKTQDGQGHLVTIALLCKERKTLVHYKQCSFLFQDICLGFHRVIPFFACYLSELWRTLKSKKLLSKLG